MRQLVYRKIPLKRPGHIYGQRANLMGLYLGGAYIWGRGAHVWEERHFNLHIVKLITFLYCSQYKTRISAYFTLCKMWNMFKVNNKALEYVKLTIKLKIKTPLTLFWSLLLNLNIFHFLWQCFCCWLWSVNCCGCCGCCLLFWHFVPLETI